MKVAVGLGSSLGDRHARLEVTTRRLAARPGLTLLRSSRWVRTPPMTGGTARGWFLNGVLLFECAAPLETLLRWCRELEERADRRRERYWGDRTLDLDLLLADGVVRDTPELVLPHPGIGRRRFVLEPLLEVWPDAIDPRSGTRLADWPPAPGPRPTLSGILARPRASTYGGQPSGTAAGPLEAP